MKNRYYSWEEFAWDVDKIVELLKEKSKKFDGIYAIPRGGLILGVCLSNRLNLSWFSKEEVSDKTLVVDDISDTGRTLERYRGRNFIVTLFYHGQSKVIPDIWLRKKKNKWIVFPWEVSSEKK